MFEVTIEPDAGLFILFPEKSSSTDRDSRGFSFNSEVLFRVKFITETVEVTLSLVLAPKRTVDELCPPKSCFIRRKLNGADIKGVIFDEVAMALEKFGFFGVSSANSTSSAAVTCRAGRDGRRPTPTDVLLVVLLVLDKKDDPLTPIAFLTLANNWSHSSLVRPL